MDITLDKKENTEASIKIKLKEEDYQPKIEEKVKEYRKKAVLKGFRPGKVPAGIIKKMYGKAIKVEEINHLLVVSLPQYIKDNNIRMVGEPLPDEESNQKIDWDTQTDFEFSFDIGLINEFDCELSDQVKITRYKVHVDDKEVNTVIENLRKQFSMPEEVEKSQAEDMLHGKLIQASSETEADVLIDLSERKDKAEPLTGASKDETVSFDIRAVFPEDQDIAMLLDKEIEEVAGISGIFEFTPDKIHRRVPAALDQDFFDKVFGKDTVTTEEAFREKVRESLQGSYQTETQNLLLRDIRDYYVKNTTIEIPEKFLKRWLKARYQNEITEEQVQEEFEDYAKDLRWNLISNKISEDKDIKIEYKDVKNKAQQIIEAQLGAGLLQQLGDNVDSFVDNYLKGDQGNNYMNVFSQARNEKIFDVIKESITIEEQEVTPDEFKEKVDSDN